MRCESVCVVLTMLKYTDQLEYVNYFWRKKIKYLFNIYLNKNVLSNFIPTCYGVLFI